MLYVQDRMGVQYRDILERFPFIFYRTDENSFNFGNRIDTDVGYNSICFQPLGGCRLNRFHRVPATGLKQSALKQRIQ